MSKSFWATKDYTAPVIIDHGRRCVTDIPDCKVVMFRNVHISGKKKLKLFAVLPPEHVGESLLKRSSRRHPEFWIIIKVELCLPANVGKTVAITVPLCPGTKQNNKTTMENKKGQYGCYYWIQYLSDVVSQPSSRSSKASIIPRLVESPTNINWKRKKRNTLGVK